MSKISAILAELDERRIAQRVGIPHDEARMQFCLPSNTVRTFDEFSRICREYYNYHFTRCVTHGGSLPPAEAWDRAKQILEQGNRQDRENKSDIVSAFRDARDGTNGGLRHALDVIADGLRSQSIAGYVTDVFDRHVAPDSWQGKVETIRDFIAHCGVDLSAFVEVDEPERYAHDFRPVVFALVQGLRHTAGVLRRM